MRSHGSQFSSQSSVLDGEALTPRERQVLRFVALGWSNDRIARALQVSHRTICNWVHRLKDKLGLENRAQLALYYFGLLPYCHVSCPLREVLPPLHSGLHARHFDR
jgi:DNA-binding NarL/FixJ family response regulator